MAIVNEDTLRKTILDTIRETRSLTESIDNVDSILKAASEVRSRAATCVIVGAGGSYLGAKAAKDFLKPDSICNTIFLGNDFDGDYFEEVTRALANKKFTILYISKSGTTLESKLAFFQLIDILKKRKIIWEDYIYVITDKNSAADTWARKNVSQSHIFYIPEEICGRYSVLTVAGLLPMAIMGIDIREILSGAYEVKFYPYVLSYIIEWKINYDKEVELIASWNRCFDTFALWLQQLYGESEGKNGQGSYPSVVYYSKDLHSIEQYIQDGKSLFKECFLYFNDEEDTTNKLSLANEKTREAIYKSHCRRGIPVIEFVFNEQTASVLGMWFMHAMIATIVSCRIKGIDPFTQPAVEKYKQIRDTMTLDF